MPRGLPATTRGLDDSMACRRADDATIRAEVSAAARVLDYSMACGRSDGATIRAEVSASARGLDDDAMVGCYNDEMDQKATMQIER